MSKVNAPLLSFSASGQIAKTQVYSKWKGRPYVRRYVIPGNPNSSEQQLTRNSFQWLNDVWKFAPASMIAAFAAYADGQVMTDRNAFIKINLPLLRPETDNDLFVFSPGAKSGLAAAAFSATPGNDLVTCAATAPSLPNGWAVSSFQCAAIRQQNPQSGVLFSMFSANDASAPYSVDITGLASAQTYVCGGWFVYTRQDGSLAYGPSSSATALTT